MRTLATGDAETTTDATPTRPSLATVIVVVPALIPVTVPSDSTRAMVALPLLNAIGRPVSNVPLSSVMSTESFSD